MAENQRKIQYQIGFKVQQENLNKLKSSLQQLQKLNLSDLMKINGNDRDKAIKAFGDIKRQADNVREALKSAYNPKLNTTNIEAFNQQLRGLGSSAQQVYDAFKSGGVVGENAFRDLSSSVLHTNIQLKQSNTLLDKMGETLGNTIKWNLASAAVNSLSRSVEQAWGFVKALDTSLNNIRVVTGKSSDQMAKFAEQANKAAKQLGTTTTDYTNAALIFAQQGLNDKEIEERTAITLKAANVTGQSTDAVSEQLTAVWNGYKVSAEEAELYIDRLAAIANTSASNLEELSTAMGKVASAAATMGVGQDQLAAQLSTIISVTRQAPESVGAALRTVYARISDIQAGIDEDGVTLGNYTGKMAELGVNVLDMNGKLRNMGEVMEEIGNRWGTMTKEQQVYLAQTMAGQRQYSNLIALFDNFERYNKELLIAQQSEGTLQKMQDTRMESTRAHLKILTASLQDVYKSLVNPQTLKSINNLIDGMASLSTIVARLIDSLGGGETILKSLGAVGVTVFSNQLAKGINSTITNLEIAKNNTDQFKKNLQGLKDFSGLSNLDQSSKDLFEYYGQLYKTVNSMTSSQFTESQQLLTTIKDLQNEAAVLQESVDKVEKPLQNFAKNGEVLKLGDVLGDVEKGERIQEIINTATENLDNFQEEVKETEKIFQELYQTADGKSENIKDVIDLFVKDSKNAVSEINKLKSSLDNIKKSDAFKGLGKDAEKAFEEVQATFDKIVELYNNPEINQQQAKKAFQDYFNALKNATVTGTDAIQKEYNDFFAMMGDPSQYNELLLKQKEIQEAVKRFNSIMDNANRTASIENWTKLAGGITQIGSSIQQLSNIGKIINNESLSIGQRIVQVITNLSFSLPMLTKGLGSVAKAFNLIKVATGEMAIPSLVEFGNRIGKIIDTNKKFTFVVGEGTTAIKLFDSALNIKNSVFAIAAITAVIAAIAGYIKYVNEANQKEIDLRNKTIDEENKKQEELAKNEELYTSIDNLNKKYQEGQISRLQLKSAVQDLIDQYKLEDQAANTLRESYDNLGQAIHNARIQAASEEVSSTNAEQEAATDAFLRKARGNIGGQAIVPIGTQDYILTLKTNQPAYRPVYDDAGHYIQYDGPDLSKESEDFINALKDLGGNIDGNGNLIFKINYNKDQILKLYDDLLKTTGQWSSKLTQEQKDGAYKQAITWINDLADAADRMKNAISDYDRARAKSIALNNSAFDFRNVDTVMDYAAKKQEYINKLQTQMEDVSPEKANTLAEDYLKTNFRQLYLQFEEASDYIEKLEKRIGKGTDDTAKEVKDKLGRLSSEQLGFIKDIQLIDITSWEKLRDILSYMEDPKNFSHLQVIADLEGAFTAASDQYNLYSSLADQISSSKKQTISKKEYESLIPQVQKFFSFTASGQYKLTGDAKKFYDLIDKLSTEGFEKNIEALEYSNERIKNIKEYDKDALFRSGLKGIKNDFGEEDYIIDKELIKTQLDYLTEMGYDLEKIIQWRAQLDSKSGISPQAINKITQAVGDLENQYEVLDKRLDTNSFIIKENEIAWAMAKKTFEELHELLDENKISFQAFTLAAIKLDEQLDLKDIDPNELDSYAKYLQKIAKESDELSDALQNDDEAAKLVAKTILKMNDAIDKLAKNWTNWKDLLQNSTSESKQYYDALQGTKDAVAELLDINRDYVSSDFIKDHLEEITEAAAGSETAIDSLKSQLSEDIIARIFLENNIDQKTKTDVLASLKALEQQFPELTAVISADVDMGPGALETLNKLIDACGFTADQCNAMFDGMGWEPVYETHIEQVQQTVPRQVTETTVTGYNSGIAQGPLGLPIPWMYPILSQSTHIDGYDHPTGEMEIPSLGNHKAPKLKKLVRKPSGSFNNYSSSNVGGGSPGKSSGGGGGSSAKPTQNNSKKYPHEDDRDIYHDINLELNKIDREFDRIQKKQDKLYGKDLINNLKQQSRMLDQHKAKIREKITLQEADLKEQKQELELLNVTFDGYGNISNYMSVLGDKQKKINDATEKYEAIRKEINQQTNKESQEELNKQLKKYEEIIQTQEKEYKKLNDRIKEYESVQKDMQDQLDQLDEDTQKQIQGNIKRFRLEIEIRLDMSQAERDWNQFKRDVLEHTNVIKDTNFDSIYGDALRSLRDVSSYFNVGGSKGSIQMLTQQLRDTRTQIEAIEESGWSAIYGNDKVKAMEDLQNDLNELMSQMTDIEGLIDEIDEAYLNTIDDVAEQFDKQIEDYKYVQELIENDIDLLSLLYGDKNYAAMDRYYTTLQNNNLKQLDALKLQRDFWKEQLEGAIANGDTKAIEQFEQNYKNAISNLNEVVAAAAQTIQDKYVNAIDRIFDELNKKISNGKGLDYLSMSWELMNKNADEYLDTINTAFGIQQVQRKYQKAINDINGIKNQQSLKTLMNEQLEILKQKEKVTQYDVERAEKLLQIEQARIALEDAQAAKTSMRLKRDSQGNYTYEYVADNTAIEQAQDKLSAARNDLYNFDKDRYQSNLNDMLSAWSDFQSQYRQIVSDTALEDEERIEKLALLRDQYEIYLNDKTVENLVIRGNLIQSAFADIADLYDQNVEQYRIMSDEEQDILMGELVPTWDSGVQDMIDKIVDEGGFLPTCKDAFEQITQATEDYKLELDEMAQVAEIDLDDVKSGVDDLAISFSELIEDNEILNDRMNDEITTAANLREQVGRLADKYGKLFQQAKKAVDESRIYLQTLKQINAIAAAQDNDYDIDTVSNITHTQTGRNKNKNSSNNENDNDNNSNIESINENNSNKNGLSSTVGGSFNGSGFNKNQNRNKGFLQTIFDTINPNNVNKAMLNMQLKQKQHELDELLEMERNDIIDAISYDAEYAEYLAIEITKKRKEIEQLQKKISGYDSGGYTGEWNSSQGKLALLHQKELVLNESDTKNILNTVGILRSLQSSFGGRMLDRLNNMNVSNLFNGGEGLEQNVHIDASFPNVNSKQEIEDAFNDLINLAAQRAMSYK